MKRLAFVLFLALFSGQADGATYYVDSQTGRNSNTGTDPASAWENISYADGMLTDGDILNVVAPATSPHRDYLMNIFNSTTIQGSGGNAAYILGTSDVSGGAAIPDLLRNGSLDGWYAPSVIWKWASVPSGAVIQDSSNYVSAPYSAAITRSTSNTYLTQNVYLESSTDYLLTLNHRESQSGMNCRLTIKETGTSYYLARPAIASCAKAPDSNKIRVTLTQTYDLIDNTRVFISGIAGTTEANGSWTIDWIDDSTFDLEGSTFQNAYVSGGTAFAWVDGPTHFLAYELYLLNANQTWLPYSIYIPALECGVYNILLRNATDNSTISIDDATLVPLSANHSWSVYNGTTYRLDQRKGVEVAALLKCAASEWATEGAAALSFVKKGAGPDLLNPGEFAWSNESLYYRLALGESDITAIHFEATRRYSVEGPPEDVNEIMTFTGTGQALRDLEVIGSANCGILQASGSLALEDVNVRLCAGPGIGIAGTATAEHCSALLSGGSGWLVNGAAASLTAGRCRGGWNDGGGFNVTAGALTLDHCIADYNGMRYASDTGAGGIGIEGDGIAATLRHTTCAYNYGSGLLISGSNNSVAYHNSISYGTAAGAENDWRLGDMTGTAFNHSNNCAGGKDAGWALGADEFLGDPLFASATGFSLQPGSPAIDAGASLYSDGDGERYSFNRVAVWSDAIDAIIAPDGDGDGENEPDLGAVEYNRFYALPKGKGTGDTTGVSPARAWNGWSDIDWDAVSDGCIICVSGGFYEQAEGAITLGKSGVTLAFDCQGVEDGMIAGRKTQTASPVFFIH